MAERRTSRLLAGAVLVTVTAGTLLAVGPGRGEVGRDAGAPSATERAAGPATVQQLCVAYAGATRADDNFLADATSDNEVALREALEVLVDVGARTELTDPQRAGVALVVDGIRSASGVDVAPLPVTPAVAAVPFAQASRALARLLRAQCEAQLARPVPGDGTGAP